MADEHADTDPIHGPDAGNDPPKPAATGAGGEAGSDDAAPPDELKDSLLHELRVHQLELEMQNEELRRAQIDLEVSRARYFDLYDLAPVGYCTLDAAGVVLEVNLTAARMFGVTKDHLVGQPLSDFIHRDSQDCFYRNRRLLQDAPTPRAFELLFQRRAGASFWAWAELHLSHGAQGDAQCRVAFTDITMLKQPGAAARRS